jgi:Tfp pilus assembly protein PilF
MFRHERYKEARKYFKKAGSLNSSLADALIGMATVYEKEGKKKLAGDMFKKARRISPKGAF